MSALFDLLRGLLSALGPPIEGLVTLLSTFTILALIVSAIEISLNSRTDEESVAQLGVQGVLLPGFALSLATALQILSSGVRSFEPFKPLIGFSVVLIAQQGTLLHILRYAAGFHPDTPWQLLATRFGAIADKVRRSHIATAGQKVRKNVSVLLIDAGLLASLALVTPLIFEEQQHTPLFLINTFASLSLIVIGSMIMIKTEDVISLVMGLSVAFNGLYVIGYTFLSPATTGGNLDAQLQLLLFLCLFSGTTLSLVIIFFLVPDLVSSSNAIRIEDQALLNERMDEPVDPHQADSDSGDED